MKEAVSQSKFFILLHKDSCPQDTALPLIKPTSMKSCCKPNWLVALSALLFLSAFTTLYAQPNIQQRVFLLGNFVDIKDKPAFISQLDQVFAQSDAPFILVLNGDLVNYQPEAPEPIDQIRPIQQLVDLIDSYPEAQMVILPGDRDWNSSRPGGEKSVQRLEELIKDCWHKKDKDRFHWAGDNGCPGPEAYEAGEGLVIAALNTQWWNHPYDKPREADALCDGLTADNLKEALDDIVEESRDKNLLIVGHHPVISLGRYGGYFPFGEHLLPLPVLGSFRTAFHAHAGNSFDLANPQLQQFADLIKTILYSHDNLIYATGHENNQQLLTFGNNYLINSGAPETGGFVGKDPNLQYGSNKAGIFEISYLQDGSVEAALWEKMQNNSLQRQFIQQLFQSACSDSISTSGFVNTAYVPCKEKLVRTASMQGDYPAKVEVAGGAEYRAGAWKRLWFGSHYRSSWATPVQTHYLDLDTTFGGLTIYKKGGGRQTTSLKFKSANGTVYTFRSIDKDPVKSLSYDLRQTIAADVIRDQTSTQQPYGAMAVAPLLDHLDILHASPVLFRLPSDPKLGPFRPRYGGLFGMLEENPGKKNDAGLLFGNADKIDKSADMFQQYYKHQNTRLQQDEFVRARLFDILIGDWSKHEDNWKWAAYEHGDFRVYRPIPRDRDHAFSRQDGIINWIADRPFGIPTIENFGYHFTGIRSLTYQARHMDRFLMQEAPKALFLEQARYIQEHISATDIEDAVHNMPPEIYEKSGRVIEAKLKSRIGGLQEAAESYYAQLAREVDITGSNDEEFFQIEYLDAGNLHIRIYDVKKNKKGETLLYDRTFYPAETREVRLWGLGNDDIFNFTGAQGKIRVRAFGGPGGDLFYDEAQARSLLYDKGDGTNYELQGHARVVRHWNKDLYEYRRTRFGYNYSSPVIGLGYSSAMGFGLNLGYFFKIRKFGKEDYHSTHTVSAGASTEGNKRAAYTGRLHQALRKWDLLLSASADDTSIRNRFFGIGNSSENLTDVFGVDYYQPKLSTYLFSLGLRRDFWQNSSFSLTAGMEWHDSKKVEQTFLSETFEDIYGANRKLETLPIGLQLDIDFRDESGLPYNGIRALLSYEYHQVLSQTDGSPQFGVASGEIEYYLSSRNKHPFTLGLRLGGADSHGDVPWYKLPTLGFTHGLRGFVETRFAGGASTYFNSELRYQLGEKKTAIVPVKVGVKVFYDHGRVFQQGREESKTWHDGYGFGLYLVPLDEALTISLSLGFSDEESAYPIFSVGTPLR